MIFLGDIASPDRKTSEQLDAILADHAELFNGKRLVCNFEGLISTEDHSQSTHPVLYNYSDVPRILNRGIAPVVCLANNHTLDLPYKFDSTVALLRQEKIPYCGAGKSVAEAAGFLTFSEGNRRIILFNACWDFLLYKQRNPSQGVYVAEINEARLIREVSRLKAEQPDAAIVIFLHWSFDLETLPFPMYRQFSRSLIDSGASLIVGTHSHCLQGGERYKEGYILYGIGNFFLPNNTFAGSSLEFPGFAALQLAFEWEPETNTALCHWFEYNNNGGEHTLSHLSTERFDESAILQRHSPYASLSDKDYLLYFRKQRRKKTLVPVYTDYRKSLTNMMFTDFLMLRARIAHYLARLGLRKWQN